MKGIITKTLGGFFFIADSEGNIYKTSIRGRIQETVYPGDRVIFSPDDRVVEELRERDNLLHRPQIANVDQVLIVHSFKKPDLDRRLIDRFLLLVESVNLSPVIVINKRDLKEPEMNYGLNDYLEAGYKIFLLSASRGQGIEPLNNYLEEKIYVMAGPSGVGKSTLLNRLILGADMPTGPVSKKLNRGVHTTSHVELLAHKNGGWIADTPGFSSLNIDHIDDREMKYLFPEFDDYLNKCKFSGCNHLHEPKCAVKDAVNSGIISEERYKSYKKFYKEVLE